MPFIGVQPATVPLTSSDITDGIISTAKIADDAVTGAKIENNPTIAGNLGVSGTTTLADNIVFSASSKGVHLGVTSATASNLQNDYEEGSFTPAYSSSGATFSSYSAQQGYYTKVGNRVCFTIYLQLDGSNSFTGNNLSITGFPFAPNHAMYYKILGRYLNIDTGSGYYDACILMSASSTTVAVRQLGDNVAGTTIASNSLSNVSGQIWLTGTYATDS